MMPYTELKKVYYSDPEHYKEIYNQRYNSPYAQHIDFVIGQAPAFFVVTPEIQSLILAIHKLDKKILLVCGELPEVALDHFSKRCLIDEIILTNHIEGVHSTRQEIDGVLTSLGKHDKRMRFQGLVQKYLMLRSNEEIPLQTCQDIRKLYDDLVLNEIAEGDQKDIPDGIIFRKGSVSVHSSAQREIHRGLYPESEIIAAMEKALAYLHDESVELLYRISVFHYLLGYIHPFYDGNGRLNRFISSYLLTEELHPFLSYRLSYTIQENLREYYNGFKICNHPKNAGDLTPFLQIFLKIIQESIEQLYSALNKRADQLHYYAKKRKHLPYSNNPVFAEIYFLLIQAELFSDHGISTQELLKNLNFGRTTLRTKLNQISEAGLLKSTQHKREKYYGIDLEALEQYGG